MITLKQETILIDKIKSLSELELTSLMEELKDHFRKNELNRIFNFASNSDLEEEIEDLKEEIKDAEAKMEEYKEKLDENKFNLKRMTSLNAQQLAFILDIKKEDARAKMCNAWEKEKGIPKKSNGNGFEAVSGALWNAKNKIQDQYPAAMPIELLAKGLGIPSLQNIVDDIRKNYLTRSASKKFILYDYPEQKLREAARDTKAFPVKIGLPPALKSMLPQETIEEIGRYWISSFTYVKDGETLPKLRLA